MRVARRAWRPSIRHLWADSGRLLPPVFLVLLFFAGVLVLIALAWTWLRNQAGVS